MLEATYKRDHVFKYPKVFQCDNESEFKSNLTKLPGKHDFDVLRAVTNHKDIDSTVE